MGTATSTRIAEELVEVDGVSAFVRRLPGEGTPAVFVHGNPTNSDDWFPFMERMRGPAVAFDLPGFGRSGRPDPGRFDYTMDGQGRFVGRLLDTLELTRYRLVVHDWGAVALLPAQSHPERVERLVVINAVPLLPGYRWHWVARIWRRRRLGELFNRGATRSGLRLVLRQARPRLRPMPGAFVDSIWEHLDRGTWDAILRLYRSADPERLAEAGRGLPALACPALVVWGDRDVYLPTRFADAYAERLPGAETLIAEHAGHWPWIDRPDLIPRITTFLETG